MIFAYFVTLVNKDLSFAYLHMPALFSSGGDKEQQKEKNIYDELFQSCFKVSPEPDQSTQVLH